MFEVLNHSMPKIEKSKVLKKLNLEENEFLTVSIHRGENADTKKPKQNTDPNKLYIKYKIVHTFSC